METTTQHDHTAPADSIRENLTVTVCQTRQGRGVHFCGHPLLSGSNSNLWFPLSESEDIHAGIERILTMNGLIENVVRLTQLHGDISYDDYTVTYNVKQPD